jgi:hypothetical protein
MQGCWSGAASVALIPGGLRLGVGVGGGVVHVQQGEGVDKLLGEFEVVVREHERMDPLEFNNDHTYQSVLNQVRRAGRGSPQLNWSSACACACGSKG